MGNIFSGHYGRRSSTPYLDQLPRVVAPRASRLGFEKSSRLFIPFNQSLYPVLIMRVRVGAMNQYHFICEQCQRRSRVLYLDNSPVRRRCTRAHYRSQSESATVRHIRQAYKTLATTALDPADFRNKIPGRHWKPHVRMLQAVESAIETIVRRNEQVMSLLRRDRSTTTGTTGK